MKLLLKLDSKPEIEPQTTSFPQKTFAYHSASRLVGVADSDFLEIAPASAGTDGASDTRDATAVAATTSPADPTSASQPTDTTAAQGNNVPTSEPSAEETAAIKATKDSAEAALNKETEPTTADTGAAKTESAPQPIDAAKPDAVKEAKGTSNSTSSLALIFP